VRKWADIGGRKEEAWCCKVSQYTYANVQRPA